MHYLFLESFSDNFTSFTDHLKWDISDYDKPIIYDLTGGRDGGPCYYSGPGGRGTLRKSIPVATNYINIGFALKLTNAKPDIWFVVALIRFAFKNNSDNTLSIRLYSAALGTTAYTPPDDFSGILYAHAPFYMIAATANDFYQYEEWNHYRAEFEGGVNIVYKNGDPFYRMYVSGWAHKNCNLAAQGSASMGDVDATSMSFLGTTIQSVTFNNPFRSYLDDVYITTDPNITEDLLVKRLNVDETVSSSWTGNVAGDQYELLDEVSCDSDSTYIYTPTKNALATFKFEDLTLAPGQYAKGYQYVCHAKRDIDAAGADLIIRDNRNYPDLAVKDLSPAYRAIAGGTTGNLSASDINDLEMTIKVV